MDFHPGELVFGLTAAKTPIYFNYHDVLQARPGCGTEELIEWDDF